MHILVVEDNEDIIEVLVPQLKNQGFVVDVSRDGASGVRKALESAYDCIVLDYGLPKKNGLLACSEIRAAGSKAPILMLSAESETERKVSLLCAGVDDYMTKPYSFDELLARINALVRRSQGRICNIIMFADVIIDLKGRSVSCAGAPVHLTIKEFALLEYLLQHRGEAVSRQDIIEHVWDVNADPFTNTIEAHISTLRKKITTEKSGSIIETVSGFGYLIP